MRASMRPKRLLATALSLVDNYMDDIVTAATDGTTGKSFLTGIIRNIADDKTLSNSLLSLTGQDARRMLDALQAWLDHFSSHGSQDIVLYLRCLYYLVELSTTSGELPPSLFLSGIDIERTRDPQHQGGFADIFRGKYRGETVALKRLRLFDMQKERIHKEFAREVLVWRQLEHPSILPFLGIDLQSFHDMGYYCMVSRWLPQGTILEVLQQGSVGPERFRWLLEVAEGLVYLHSIQITHGDIHSRNILIDENACARITDFGNTVTVGNALDTLVTTTVPSAGAPRWMSPERFILDMPEKLVPAGDVWAFGCLCLMMYTYKEPFYYLTSAAIPIRIGRKKEIPMRPSDEECHGHPLRDELWSLMTKCWSFEASDRPRMTTVIEQIKTLEAQARNDLEDVNKHPPSPKVHASDLSSANVARRYDTTGLGRIDTLLYLHKSQNVEQIAKNLLALLSAPNEKEYAEVVLPEDRDKARSFVNFLQSVLNDYIVREGNLYRHRSAIRQLMANVVKNASVLPDEFNITGVNWDNRGMPDAGGTYGDVLIGQWNGSEVAIKRLRMYDYGGIVNTRRNLYREAITCLQLRHERLLPLLGVIDRPDRGQFCLITPWINNGTLRQYQRRCLESTDSTQVNPLPLLIQVAEGLLWLHSESAVHGDVQANNILVDNEGNAKISDFGLTVWTNTTSPVTGPTGGSSRWMAPELLLILYGEDEISEKWRPTFKADVYSFAHTIIEAYTLKRPFPKISRDNAVILKVIQGHRPPRPGLGECFGRELSDALWTLVERCWAQEPTQRPEMNTVLTEMRSIQF